MPSFLSKKTIVVISLFALFGIFLFLYLTFRNKEVPAPQVVKVEVVYPIHTVIGKSVQGRDIDAYTYGAGKVNLVFVGGVHGGYEWNSVLVAYKFKDFLDANLKSIPENITVTLVPSANPDGLFKIVGKEGRFEVSDIPKGLDTSPGRFNANGIDLNRNFDCKWKPRSTWRNKTVSAGTKPFSEPEAMAIKNLAESLKPEAFIFWHSQSGAVYASQCEKGILPETLKIMDAYAKASGYKPVPTFDAYETTGDSEAWLAKVGIPAITVELTTHEDVEWEKNLAGIKSIFEYYRYYEK